MPVEITMPQLSDTMTEGTLVKWLKREGDKVRQGEVIAEVETDKATMEWEASDSGTLALIAAPEGSKVKVGGTIAVLASGSENPQDVKSQYQAGGSKQAPPPPAPAAKGAPGASSHDTEMGHEPLEEGRAMSRREAVRVPPERTSESLSQEALQAVRQQRPAGVETHEQRMRISPLARRLAAERGIDLSRVQGSGPGGRIVQSDVIGFVEKTTAIPKPPPSATGPALRIPAGQKMSAPVDKMRATIATRLQQAKQQIPHFYETYDIDVEAVSQLRQQMNKALEPQGIRLSIGDFVAKAVSTALLMHPALNAHYKGNEIIRYGDVNLGMAVALPEGLIVPVLRGIDAMTVKEIRTRSADLVERARAKKLKGDEMTGATFTVSNLGTYGVSDFSAIINPPEVAILAVAGAEKRPVVRNDQVVIRAMMKVTLSADHRAVDGATAAEFLRTLKQLLEEPGMILV